MNRILSTPNLSLRQAGEPSVRTSLLDNWQYQPGLAQSHSQPTIMVDNADVLPSTTLNLDVNHEDLDCLGHGRSRTCSASSDMSTDTQLAHSSSSESLSARLACSSSSEGMYDSSEEDAWPRVRSMSTDEAEVEEDKTRTVTFSLQHDDWPEEEEQYYPECDTPTIRTPTGTAAAAGFFKLERRASFDNGVFGMSDRIVKGELMVPDQLRKAVTAPGTPADPSTPMARFGSEEELTADPQEVFQRIYNRESSLGDRCCLRHLGLLLALSF